MIGTNFKVIKAGKYGAIDQNGKVLVEPQFDEIRPIQDSMYIGLVYHDSAALQKLELRNHWNWGYKVKDCIVLDKDFRIVTELKEYEYIYYWGISRFIVKKNGQFGVLNQKGEVVIPLEYEHISGTNGYYLSGKKGRYGLINTEGKVVLPIEFNHVDIYEKAVYVVKDGLTGVYNDQFRLIAEPQFKESKWYRGRIILTRPDGSEGFVDHTRKGDSYYQSPEGTIQKL
jgi:hypothetical protein